MPELHPRHVGEIIRGLFNNTWPRLCSAYAALPAGDGWPDPAGTKWLRDASRFIADLLADAAVRQHAEACANLRYDLLVKAGVKPGVARVLVDWPWLIRANTLPHELTPVDLTTRIKREPLAKLKEALESTDDAAEQAHADAWRIILKVYRDHCPSESCRLEESGTLGDGTGQHLTQLAGNPAAVHAAFSAVKDWADSAGSSTGDLFRRVREAMPDPVELADDDYFKLKAHVETMPPETVTWSRVQQEKLSGQTAYQDELRAYREWRAALRRTLEYNRLKRETAAKPTEAGMTDSPKRKRGRRRRTGAAKPLTDLQRQAVELYGKHHGRVSEVAREMGVTHQAASKHLQAAWRKVPGLAPPKRVQSRRTRQLPTDRRGQPNL